MGNTIIGITRREMLKRECAGIAGILAAGVASGAIVRSLESGKKIGRVSKEGGGVSAVEYLESTGTQYINTGINPQSSTTWSTDIVCLPKSGVTYMSLIGYSYNTLGIQSVGITQSKWSQTSLVVDYANPTLVHADQNGQIFNGIQGNSNNIGKGLLYLFNRANVLTQYPWAGKIYSAKIWIESILVRDFKPVHFTNELGQSEGAMYDRVSGQFFRNQGTGAFIIGPDV